MPASILQDNSTIRPFQISGKAVDRLFISDNALPLMPNGTWTTKALVHNSCANKLSRATPVCGFTIDIIMNPNDVNILAEIPSGHKNVGICDRRFGYVLNILHQSTLVNHP